VTVEDRYVIELSELHTVRFDCTNAQCSATISLKMGDWRRFPDACPICKTTWYHEQSSVEYQNVSALMIGLQETIGMMKENRSRPIGFRMRFELDRQK
jgi:hypothetical protein